jgi:PucR C-terminal helix-turn-helix domain/GGDEF-like domain
MGVAATSPMMDLPAGIVLGSDRDVRVAPAARALAADIDAARAATAVTGEIRSAVWPGLEDASFHAALSRSVHDTVRAVLDLLAGRTDAGVVPSGALEFAAVAAYLDIPAAQLEKAYRVAIASLWWRWWSAARARADDALGLQELIGGPTRTIHVYFDHVLDDVIPRYQEVSAELHRSRRDHRRMVLAQILDGSIDAITEELDHILAYSLGDTHLAAVIETPGISPPTTDVARLRDAADARATLLAQHTARTWLVWLGRPGGFAPTNLSRLRRALVDTGLAIAVGEPADGLAGLRRTRQHALETQRVQHALGDGCRCLWAHEVRLETLLLGDQERARAFLTDELGPLGAGDSFARRLRETLLAWLTMGSHGSAAAILGVHENTVRNRLRAAEELLGVPLTGRRTELMVALRLERLLGSAPGEGAAS